MAMGDVKLKYKVPKQIGAAVDLLYKVREARKLLDAKSGAEKAQETMIEDAIFNAFDKSDLEGARGKLAQASISRSDVPTVKDWPAFEKYVIKSKALDLLQRRVSVEAFRERVGQGVQVPGIEIFTKVRLHLSKTAVSGKVKAKAE